MYCTMYCTNWDVPEPTYDGKGCTCTVHPQNGCMDRRHGTYIPSVGNFFAPGGGIFDFAEKGRKKEDFF
jgi:hypothetical protein